MSISQYKKTFTLIEMLIVIVIIGILAAALVPRLNDVQSRARDTKRKADFQQLKTALELYKIDRNTYPRSTYSVTNGCNLVPYNDFCNTDSQESPTNWIYNFGTSYITALPRDPINDNPVPNQSYSGPWVYNSSRRSYVYSYHSETTVYSLLTRLENKQDPDRCGKTLASIYNSSGHVMQCNLLTGANFAGFLEELYSVSSNN